MPCPAIVYPRLIDAAGRCPPEDVGGPWGYREFLNAFADPNHQEHAEMLQWIGRHFDPNDVDAEALAPAIPSLAELGTRRPSGPGNAADPRCSPMIQIVDDLRMVWPEAAPVASHGAHCGMSSYLARAARVSRNCAMRLARSKKPSSAGSRSAARSIAGRLAWNSL